MLTLEDVKKAISVTHNDDDAFILTLIESAAMECATTRYGTVPDYSLEGAVPDPLTVPVLARGICFMVRADYEADPLDRQKLKLAATDLWLYDSGWTL
jgi:hypothetical protein